jgi:basic amino acid/polyamine antiporter, APA family
MPTSTSSTLPRRLGFWSALAVLVGSAIGSGIFRSPAGIAEKVPETLPFMGVWVAGGLLALCGALTLAELAGALPETGGFYVFLREGWGRLPAFLFGWAELIIIRAVALGAVSITFAEYLLRSFGLDPRVAPNGQYAHYIAAAAITCTWMLNYWGVRQAARLQNVTAVLKYAALIFIVLTTAAILLFGGGASGPEPAPVATGKATFASFGLALISVMWVYDGWADVSFIGGEVTDPRRNLPRVFITGTLAIMGIYLAVNAAYLSVIPVTQMPQSRLVAADVLLRLVGNLGVVFVTGVVVMSTFGTLNGSMLTGPRIIFAMAADGLLFRKVAAVHPRYETPYVAISVVSVFAIVGVLFGTFEQLADAFITAIIPFYALGVAAIFRLRRRADYDPPFRVPLYPLLPVLFIVAVIAMLLNALTDPTSRLGTAIILGIVISGIPVYYFTIRRRAVEPALP